MLLKQNHKYSYIQVVVFLRKKYEYYIPFLPIECTIPTHILKKSFLCNKCNRRDIYRYIIRHILLLLYLVTVVPEDLTFTYSLFRPGYQITLMCQI